MSKQVDLSDPNLDLSQLCLRGDKEAIINSIKRDMRYKEDSIFAFDYLFVSDLGDGKESNSCCKNGSVWRYTSDFYDIIYKADYEAKNEN